MKRILALLLSLCLLVALVACGADEEPAQEPVENPPKATVEAEPAASEVTEWAIYWYLCGSDLETNYGAASNDLAEMMSVELPENVKIVIQTGGAATWMNDFVSAETIGRYVYSSEGLVLVEELPSANMGDPQTLTDFLSFAKENYPANRTMVSFWNHGGGSVTGAAFDELYGGDSLTLPEMYGAFTSVYTADGKNQPIDLVGFDTCLMATVDTAYTFSDLAKYLVASEELEPGNGWLYSGIMQALADTPTIEPLELGKVICDTYVQGCEEVGTQDNITLSVTDLSKIGNLLTAYDNFGKEALASAVENPAFFAHFAQIAGGIENYGGNTREQGFTNMADLGDLALSASDLLPTTSADVVAALADCVVYKVNGIYRPESAGLACYYSYNGDFDDFMAYADVGPSDAFKYFYAYGLTGTLPADGMRYLEEMNYTELPELLTLNTTGWEDMPLTVDPEGCATLTLGPEAVNVLASLTFELYYADPDNDMLLCLGTDNDIIADWENGVFKDNFRGVWGSLDGALCYMEIVYEGEDFNLYNVPVLLNGEMYNLSVIYDFTAGEYIIEGARKPLDENGAADKNLRYLVEGDQIDIIHYITTISGEDQELEPYTIETIKVTPETSFTEAPLPDGYYIMMYAMQDSQGNQVYSGTATFESAAGEIFTTVE